MCVHTCAVNTLLRPCRVTHTCAHTCAAVRSLLACCMEKRARVYTRVCCEHLTESTQGLAHACALARGGEEPAGTLHRGMHTCAHACAARLSPRPRTRVCAPREGLTRPARGRGAGWGVRSGVRGSLSPLTLVTQTTSELPPRDAQTSQKLTDPNPTCKQKRAGAGPLPPACAAAPPAPHSAPARPRLPLPARPRGRRAGTPPGQGSPADAGVPGGAARGRRPVLSWGTGPRLYQMPLDRPPGGARIRAEARFGTWSSI